MVLSGRQRSTHILPGIDDLPSTFAAFFRASNLLEYPRGSKHVISASGLDFTFFCNSLKIRSLNLAAADVLVCDCSELKCCSDVSTLIVWLFSILSYLQ